jgi:hypothetical protein
MARTVNKKTEHELRTGLTRKRQQFCLRIKISQTKMWLNFGNLMNRLGTIFFKTFLMLDQCIKFFYDFKNIGDIDQRCALGFGR